MNKSELYSKLSELLNNNDLIGEIYFVLKSNDSVVIKMADIDSETQKELTKQFIDSINDNIINNTELDVMKLSGADERSNVLYKYDFEEKPVEMNIFEELYDNEEIPFLNFRADNFKDIKGILILIAHGDNTLIIYKHHYSVSLVKKDSSFNLVKLGNNQRLVKLESDILKINSSFDFFSINKNLFIKNMKTLESHFKFHEIVFKNARESIEVIKNTNLIENPSELDNMISNVTFARKLVKTAKTSPVLGNVPNSEIIKFINNFPSLQGKLVLNEAGNKISLRTKKSKELIIKVLNDDYLQSELTKYFYDSFAKDSLGEYNIG